MDTTTTTTPAAPQPTTSHWKRNTGIGVGAFLALMLIIGACNPTATSTGFQQGYNGTPVASPPSPAPAVTALSPQASISSWYANGAQTRLNAITTDLGAASTAGANTDITAMNAACRSLRNDVEAAQAYPPVPDTAVQTSWAAGLAAYARAATDCTAGTSTANPTLLNRSAQEMTTGTASIQTATALIQKLNG